MQNIYCAKCRIEIKDGTVCNAITSGQIRSDYEGFFPSDAEGWDVLCPDCASRVYEFISQAGKQETEEIFRLLKEEVEAHESGDYGVLDAIQTEWLNEAKSTLAKAEGK